MSRISKSVSARVITVHRLSGTVALPAVARAAPLLMRLTANGPAPRSCWPWPGLRPWASKLPAVRLGGSPRISRRSIDTWRSHQPGIDRSRHIMPKRCPRGCSPSADLAVITATHALPATAGNGAGVIDGREQQSAVQTASVATARPEPAQGYCGAATRCHRVAIRSGTHPAPHPLKPAKIVAPRPGLYRNLNQSGRRSP